ncbi:hypothetical protein ACJMK2_020542 [Sinanodonta woodiana]|uniref:Mitochondrial ribosomal protein S21 n=1 Tax=Sinanodonta woodiana TaxID=1069815 RepID=A0ABD3U1P2_SINWO
MFTKNHYLRFLSRTVLVKNNDIESAYRTLDRLLRNEGIHGEIMGRMYYEKPFEMRRRVSFERCRRIYSADMGRKIQFVMRKNRMDPFPR